MSLRLSRPISAAALVEEAAAFRSPAFAEALAGAAALMAHADGEMAPAERGRLRAMLRDDPRLAEAPQDTIVEAMAVHEANFRLDPEVAIEIASEPLDAIRAEPRLCSAVIAACRAMIPADGVAHPSEFRMLADIRARLGLTARPVPFGSYGVHGTAAPERSVAP